MTTTTPRTPRALPTRRVAAALALASLAAVGCRDRAGFTPAERRPEVEQTGASWQVTFNIGDDRSPAWSAGSDSVYYAAEGFPGLPDAPGVLLAVPRGGGGAVPLVPEQIASTRVRWFTAPARSEGRLAYAEVVRLNDPMPCFAPSATCPVGPERRVPPLAYIGLRTRPVGGDAPLPDQPPLLVAVEGRAIEGDVVPLIHARWHPFQAVFHQEAEPLFRPSWAPDASRLVFSDGLRLLLWTPGGGEPSPIPGTDDGVAAAWSPAGDWIAYTRLARGDSTVTECSFVAALGAICHERRVFYEQGAPEVVLVRPDGSETRVLGEGDQPAWAPGGSVLYYRRGEHLWRRSVDGLPQQLPGTRAGGEPAISPDGRFLAFTRRASPGNHDVWVLSLELVP